MSLTIYIIDEQGKYSSADKTKRYSRLSGKQLHRYLNSPEGKNKRFFIDRETEVGVEIPRELVPLFRKEERRAQYLSDIKKKYNYKLVSLSEPSANESISGEEVIPDTTVNVEDTAEVNITIEELHKALHRLTDEERDLMNHLFLSKNCCSQEQLADQLGISQQAVSKRCQSVLMKLKKFLS